MRREVIAKVLEDCELDLYCVKLELAKAQELVKTLEDELDMYESAVERLQRMLQKTE